MSWALGGSIGVRRFMGVRQFRGGQLVSWRSGVSRGNVVQWDFSH